MVMTQKELAKIWRGRVRPLVEELLITKGEEYANGDDRLQNFKQAARFIGCSSDKALLGFVTKQLVSWYDYTERGAKGEEIPYEKWEEKLLDVIIYAFLHLCIRLEKEAGGPLITGSGGSKEMV